MVYKIFKALATSLSIALFLSHGMSPEETQKISDLMTTHWRGIISVPMNMRGPWSLWQSGYSKALTAKAQLRDIITETIKSKSSVLVRFVRTRSLVQVIAREGKDCILSLQIGIWHTDLCQ